ncbi:hypothetical protein CEK62_20450 (plasmid) [Alcanivorax sp. N3-2A]|nr:hypothetical protein CEK62_00260 [Alcanivorax sp. N3-2A]ASK36740.1 hypothetical protein CEK62_20450 [Alcanivorax sp. N3-2A]|tara:strand:+ start:23039 stop:23839 length:801 start_codon:yes stop_codon:yes gene_type:complete
MFYERDTTGQILSLARITTLARLRVGVGYLLEAHGFHYYVFTCHTVAPEGTRTLRLGNLPAGVDPPNAPFNDDPLACYAALETLPMDWRTLMTLPDYQQRGYRVTMARRARHGLRSGCTVPLLQGAGVVAWLDLASERNDEESWKRLRGYLPYATLLGRVILDKIRRLNENNAERPDKVDAVATGPAGQRLDERELACLRAASEGHRNGEIGVLLGISERTVSSHIHNACQKLHARNRQHAITKALLSRQLTLEAPPLSPMDFAAE